MSLVIAASPAFAHADLVVGVFPPEPGEYAEACLLPGDPLRAKYIAETYFDDVQQRNSERGLLGYSGSWEGKPVSVQGTGMGCPRIDPNVLIAAALAESERAILVSGDRHLLALADSYPIQSACSFLRALEKVPPPR